MSDLLTPTIPGAAPDLPRTGVSLSSGSDDAAVPPLAAVGPALPCPGIPVKWEARGLRRPCREAVARGEMQMMLLLLLLGSLATSEKKKLVDTTGVRGVLAAVDRCR